MLEVALAVRDDNYFGVFILIFNLSQQLLENWIFEAVFRSFFDMDQKEIEDSRQGRDIFELDCPVDVRSDQVINHLTVVVILQLHGSIINK